MVRAVSAISDEAAKYRRGPVLRNRFWYLGGGKTESEVGVEDLFDYMSEPSCN